MCSHSYYPLKVVKSVEPFCGRWYAEVTAHYANGRTRIELIDAHGRDEVVTLAQDRAEEWQADT
jgi:hypothetical protein